MEIRGAYKLRAGLRNLPRPFAECLVSWNRCDMFQAMAQSESSSCVAAKSCDKPFGAGPFAKYLSSYIDGLRVHQSAIG